jgi:two-component system sensor histidine kinase/response regulator
MSDPLTDPLRLAALERTGLLDSAPEEVFDRLTRLATRLLGTEIASMTLVDGERQFFKSAIGLTGRETPLSHSLCQYVVADGAPLVVEDARQDERLRGNGSTREGTVIAYAGVPLADENGQILGSFCAASASPRAWTQAEIDVLTELATSAMTELRLRAARDELALREAALREAELALRENNRMLDESQRVAGLGSWGWNLENGEPWWSEQQFHLYGFDPGQDVPIFDELLARVHPDDRGRLAECLRAQVVEHRSFSDEFHVQVPRRGLRTLLIRGDYLPADPGLHLPARVAGTTQDVTAERTAEAARRAAETRSRELLSSLPDTVVTLYDRELRCQLVDGALAELGIDPARFEGRPIAETLPDEQQQVLVPVLRRVIAGVREAFEYRTTHGRTYHVDAVPYRPGGEEILGAFTVWRDITPALERERQTRMLATIVQQSDDAIIAKDRQGIITEWNRGAELLYGYRAAEAIGRSISMLVPPERDGEDRVLLSRALQGESIAQHETVRMRQDGSRVHVSVSISPLQAASGTIVGASIIARDVTERRRAEEELRASRERALEASRLKSEFVANMSHEIRTPLNGVVSMIELLRQTDVTLEQREYADVALTSAEALMRVINDILDFSKIEAGKLEIVNEDFTLRDAVEEVSEIVGIKALERGVEMRISVDPQIADTVRGDGNRVRQVLMNLLSNAVKFTAQGHISVSVSHRAAASGRPQLCIEVADTGIGIDPERLAVLFEPFSQEDATTTRRYGGTGLGLCISKQLVELMGGEIGCESALGEGSRFWFTLPYVEGVAPTGDPTRSDLTGTRILIIDGVADQAALLARHLASWGVSPDTAADGLSALQMLRRAADAGRPYEAALIGRTVPERDELELARSITSVPALRATRLILVTPAAVDATAARAAGIEDQLIKPIRQSRLYNQLVATIYRARAARAASPQLRPAEATEPAGSPGARVLVVDDNEVNRFAAIRLLQTLGLNVDVATDGREAITMSGRRNYAAIFMDCQMPNVDGYTASRMIRKRDRGTRRTPIIALTAHALEGDREKCLAAGMDDYIAKPLRLQTVEALIQRLPALRAAGPSPRSATPAAISDPIFDPAPLGEIDDPETEAALAMMFLDQATERIPALLEAIETPDHERLHSLAHGLKGSAATVGAHRMSQLARTLCEIAEAARAATAADDPTGPISPHAAEVHTQLANALNQTRTAMDTYIARVCDAS